jgi:hypothetical protein
VAILALIGFLTGKRFGAVLGITTLVVLLLSLGRGTPWWVVYKAIPLLSILRSPSRLFSLVAFFAALGAALGVTALSRQAVARGSLYGKLAQLALLAIVLGALFKRASNRAHVPWTVSPEDLAGPRELWGTVERVTAGGRTALPVDSIDFTVGLRQGMMKRIPVVQDYEPISSRRAAAYLRAVAGLPPPSPTEAFPFDGAVTLTKRIVRPQLLDLLAVRSVVLPLSVPPPERVPPFEAVTRDAFHVVYANPLALARAYTVAHARFVDTEQEALAAVLEQGFDGRRDAVVLNRPEGDEAMLLSQDPTPLHEARIITDLPERVEVEFDVSQPSLLVLADSFAPGWSVRVDAAARSVRQVNAYVRGVFIRPGEHRAEFRYHAPGFAAGLGIAVAAWGVALLLIARSRVG